MKHYMNLYSSPFELIKNQKKDLELRLNDEKRQLINIGDCIEFKNIDNNEIILVKVVNKYLFSNFEELYSHFDKSRMGYLEYEIASYQDMELYYSKDEINKYGVVAIEIVII